MTELYDVSFTTKKMVNSYDEKGKLIEKKTLNNPIVMTRLPYNTALAYKGCDNFKMERHVPEHTHRRASGSSRPDWAAAATKKSKGVRKGEVTTSKSSVGAGRSKVQEAAQSGDMSAAINQ